MFRTFSLGLILFMTACKSDESVRNIDWQGHRGARGVYPENSLPAFRHALDVGMNTLEMDVVITADSQVVVSHEPFMSSVICVAPDGDPIPESAEKSFNIFRMTFNEVAMFDCGSRQHPRFPDQKKMKISKPLLSEVFQMARKFADSTGLPMPEFNIEIKSRPEWDGRYHPVPKTYVDLVLREVQKAGVMEKVTIQSFDYRPLQILDEQQAAVKLAFLNEGPESISTHSAKLTFVPDIYSP